MNLFKKIWKNHIAKAQNESDIERMVRDVSPKMKGMFTWKQYSKQGRLIDQETNHNAVTVGGKSNIIRLLAQSNSQRIGNINPAQLRISKMAFGNALPTDGIGNLNVEEELALHYYDLSERSCRVNNSIPSNDNLVYPVVPKLGAGGLQSYTPAIQNGTTYETGAKRVYNVTGSSDPNSTSIYFRAGTTITINLSGNQAEFPNLILGDSNKPSIPPQHKSFFIELHSVPAGAGEGNLAPLPYEAVPTNPDGVTLIQRLHFDTDYSKSQQGNLATSLRGNFVGMVGSPSVNDPVLLQNRTKLYFDTLSNTWKLDLVVREGTEFNGHLVQSVRMYYQIGGYNIKNSLVPRLGVNNQTGETYPTRFNSSAGIEFYNIASVTMADAPTIPIDDYMATFNVIMPANEGNGAGNGSVYYTEAFLFNERNDLFSIIRMEENKIGIPTGTPRGFIKNQDSSFLLSWSLSIEV